MRKRIEHVAPPSRTPVNPSALGSSHVFHYSIPSLDETGDGSVEEAATVGDGKTLLRGGEVLVSKLNPRKQRILRAETHEIPTVCSSEFVVLQPKDIDPRFLEYFLRAETTRQHLDSNVQSVTRSQQRVRPETITKMWIDVPLPARQGVIADYLDTETSRIHALIAKKRRMIELLTERWQSTMAAGVSGELLGLPPASPTRIPWLRTMPADWRRAKLNLIARLGSGHTPSRQHPDWWEGTTIPWITTGEVSQVRDDRREYVTETREKISEIGLANSAAELHPADTVVLCRTASAGYSAIMGGDMATSQDFATWTCGPLLRPRFLLLCLRVMRQDLLGRLAVGSTHKTIYMPDIESIVVPLPSVEIQEAVIEAVYSRLPALDASIDLLMRQTKLLVEHRQALLTAAVIGEIDVPGAAA